MIITVTSVLALLFSLTGNILINFQKKSGYVFWIISNILWIIINFIDHLNVSQVIMYVVYTAFNIWGLKMWSEKGEKS